MLILNHNVWHQYSTVPSGSKNPLHIRLNIKKMKKYFKNISQNIWTLQKSSLTLHRN